MKQLSALALLAPLVAMAGSAFDGNWMMNVSSMKVTGKPLVFSLSNGVYHCSSCAPPYSAKADGTDQPIPGRTYADQVAIKVVDPSTVTLTQKLKGKVSTDIVLSVSTDGSMLMEKATYYLAEKPTSESMSFKRSAAGPAGSHAVSGTWQQGTTSDMSAAGKLLMFKSTDHGMQLTWNGEMVDAKFDGKPYPWTNDPTNGTSSFRKISDSEFTETDYALGKVTDVTTYTMSADGKSITQVDRDKPHGVTTTVMLEKQP